MKALLDLQNVVGYGDGEDGSVVVLVTKKLPLAALSTRDVIPPEVEGRGTKVLQVGDVRAQRSPTDKWDPPLPGGVSIGHRKVTAGTLGMRVYELTTGNPLILSNNHVLANSNDAELGDVILQPGFADGGRSPNDVVGELHRFEPIDFGSQPPTCPIVEGVERVLNVAAGGVGSSHRIQAVKENAQAVNRVDGALCKPNVALAGSILDVGIVRDWIEVGLGAEVAKSGRTTGFTTGNVLVLDATIQVSYGNAGSALFEGQIITSGMSAPGDSGSAGVVFSGSIVSVFGLLFAGSQEVTIYNPIVDVLSILGIYL